MRVEQVTFKYRIGELTLRFTWEDDYYRVVSYHDRKCYQRAFFHYDDRIYNSKKELDQVYRQYKLKSIQSPG